MQALVWQDRTDEGKPEPSVRCFPGTGDRAFYGYTVGRYGNPIGLETIAGEHLDDESRRGHHHIRGAKRLAHIARTLDERNSFTCRFTESRMAQTLCDQPQSAPRKGSHMRAHLGQRD